MKSWLGISLLAALTAAVISAPAFAAHTSTRPERTPSLAAPLEQDEQVENFLRMQTLLRALEARADELRALLTSYRDADELDSIGPQRKRLRGDISRLVEELWSVRDASNRAFEIYRIAHAVRAVKRVSSGRYGEAYGDVLSVTHDGEFLVKLKQTLNAYTQLLIDEERAFELARTRLAMRRMRRGAALGGAAICAILGVWLGWSSRRTPPSSPTPPPPSAAGPPRPVPEPPSRALPIPRVIGEFRVIKELEAWPFGEAFEAEGLTDRRTAVLRVFHAAAQGNERDEDLLLQELRRTVRLRHRNLEETLSVFIDGGRIAVAVTPFEGERLSHLVRTRSLRDFSEVKRIFSQVLLACEYLHGEGVVLGTLHPDDILVSGSGRVKVALAVGMRALKIAAQVSQVADRTRAPYLAPEVELGTVVPESDIFSLGVILLEMATGTVPFSGSDSLREKRKGLLSTPGVTWMRLPGGIFEVVHKMLAPAPADRFRTASDVFDALMELPDVP